MKISKFFTWAEALYLPTWKREALGSDGLDDNIKANLVRLFEKMDTIRSHFSRPVVVHVSYRPIEYNKLVGGAPNSAHTKGMACDFHVDGLSCDEVRQNILDNSLLESLDMRMENLPGSSWVHLDISVVKPGGNRFFKP